MSLPSATSRLFFRWMLPSLLAGLFLGGAGGWWLARKQANAGARRLAQAMASGLKGPRQPPAPAVGRGRSESANPGIPNGEDSVPVIGAADNLELALMDLVSIADPAVRQVALIRFLETLPVDRWQEYLKTMETALNDLFDFDVLHLASSLGIAEGSLVFMMKREPELVINWNDKNAEKGGAEMFQLWAGQDLPAAMAYFEKRFRARPPDKQGGAAVGLAMEFVKTDPESAFGWIKGLPKDNQPLVAGAAFHALLMTDADAARRYLMTVEDLPDREGIAQQVAYVSAVADPEGTLAWAKGLPQDLSLRAVQGAIAALANKDFSEALKQATTLAPAQQDAVMGAMADTVSSDASRLPGLLQLVEQAPEGPGRAQAARNSLQKWSEGDPEAASAWVAAQPLGPTRDAAIQGFGSAVVVSRHDPHAGLEWTAVISDESARRGSLVNNVRTWSEFDSTSARAWVESSPRLSEADREILLPLTQD